MRTVKRFVTWHCFIFATIPLLSFSTANAEFKAYRWSGLCDASAVIPTLPGEFLVVSDEDNLIRQCGIEYESGCIPVLNLDAFLEIDTQPASLESDLEGSATIGNRIYWISSHGRDGDGAWQSNRHRLFATTLGGGLYGARPQALGKPYAKLAHDLEASDKLAELPIAAAIRSEKQGKVRDLAPKRQGLNIEGLASTSAGELLVGLRNPLAEGKLAIMVGIDNPAAVVDRGETPKLTAPTLLDLGGRGIRSIERWPGTEAYLILAGAIDSETSTALYSWTRDSAQAPRQIYEFTGLNPEGMTIDSKGRVFIASDDGSVRGDGNVKCKKIPVARHRWFRMIRLDIDPPD